MKLYFKLLMLGVFAFGAFGITSTNAMNSNDIKGVDRHVILDQFSQGNFEIPSLDNSIQRVLVMFGDPGFDGSDILEEIAAYTIEKDAVIINITNLWKPHEKAALLHSVARYMGRTENVYFCPGYGYYDGKDQDFSKVFPAWPKAIFGDAEIQNPPLEQATSEDYKGIYNEQLKAYHNLLGEEKGVCDFKEQDVIGFIKNILKEFGNNYVLELFISGPTGDAARLLADDELSSHVRLCRGIMGGGFGKFGAESRLGYNFVIDPNGTKKLIDQIRNQNIPSLIVTSQTCTTIPIQKEDFINFINASNKTPLGQAVADGWNNWNKHMSLKRKTQVVDYNICDLLTFMLSYHPKHIGQFTRGYYNMYPEKVSNNIHMLSAGAKELFDSVMDDQSPMFFVESINDPNGLYRILMDATVSKLTHDNSSF